MNEPIDEAIIAGAFFEFMLRNGIKPRDNFTLIMDGQIHRFSTESDKHGSTSGAYFLHADGWPNGGVMDYHIHHGMVKFILDKDLVPRNSRPSHDEYERQKAENERRQAERIKLQKKNEQACIKQASDFWHSDSINHDNAHINQHPYMRFKQVSIPLKTNCSAGITHDGKLVFPLFDSLTGNFRTLQFVSPPDPHGHSQKWFYKGISTVGVCYPIRQYTGDTLFVAEGIITAFSVDEFTHGQFSVVAALNCGNLLHICRNYKARLNEARKYNPSLPVQKIIITADNDANHAGEIAARRVISEGYAEGYTMPPIVGHDWNDYLNHLKGQNNE